MNLRNDASLRSQAHGLGYDGIPARLDGPWRQALQRYIDSHVNNALNASGLQYYDVQWPVHVANPWSGEFRFRFRARPGVPLVLTRDSFGTLERNLKRMFANARDYVLGRARLGDRDYIQFKLWSDDEQHYISSAVRRVKDQTMRDFIASVVSALQSAAQIDLGGTRLVITYARRTEGGSYPLHGSMTLDKWIKSKQTTIAVIDSKDTEDCFWQCLAICMEGEQRPELYRSRSKLQRSKTGAQYRAWLLDQGLVFHHDTHVNMEEMLMIEEAMEISIDVVRAYDLRALRWSNKPYETHMILLQTGEQESQDVHFHFVKPGYLGALFGRRKFCNLCHRGYDNIRHKCIKKCFGCKRDDCKGKQYKLADFQVQCDDCHRYFYDERCMTQHLAHCQERVLCEVCHVIYSAKDKKTKKHVCFQDQCKNCKRNTDVREKHECYMTQVVVDVDKPRDPPDLFFYDYECYFSGQEHRVALVVVLDSSDGLHVFETNEAFVDYIMTQKNAVFIAHNAARYDSHFVKRMLLEKGIVTQDVVNGCSMMEMKIVSREIRFIDSLKFIPMPLRHFPKTFGIQDLSKGYFPYRFFTEQHLHYKGPMPAREWFEFDKMNPAEKQKAETWYNQHELDVIDLWEMCKNYCVDDVKLLAAGCRMFQESFMEVTVDQFSPFEKITIAGVCLKIFKSFFLERNLVGIYEPNMKENVKLAHWKKQYAEHGQFETIRELGLVLAHTEQGVDIFRLCLDSGCMDCYNRFTTHPTSFQSLYTIHNRVEQYLATFSHSSVTRECQYKEEARPEECGGLDIREALYGGRTEVFWEKCIEGEMGYVDFTSLYPYVLYGKDAHGYLGYDYEYPVGHPTLLQGRLTVEDLQKSFGFAKCKVRAPPGLQIPLLPHRRDNKLMFELGTFVGTWTTIELKKAMEIGYEVLNVYAIVHFEQKRSDLFRGYIQEFYRKKIEATGWKKLGLKTEQERTSFLREMEQRYDITGLQMTEEYNAGMYYISKICLNSLWGKFAQRESFCQTRDVFTEEECFALLEDDTLDVNNIFLHSRDARSITYRKKKGFNKKSDTNVAIAAYTTAYGRLCLYSLLELLGPERVLYCDTDSVVYRKTEGLPELPIGSFLGQLTDELEGDAIVKFVATGPKSYAYLTDKGKESIKMKGFTLNQGTKSRIHFKRLLEIAEGEEDEHEMVPGLVFRIGKDHLIATKVGAEKKFRRTQNKRRRVMDGNNIRSEPHVYRHS